MSATLPMLGALLSRCNNMGTKDPGLPLTVAEIAELEGVSRQRIDEILRTALGKLRRQLARRKINSAICILRLEIRFFCGEAQKRLNVVMVGSDAGR